MHFATYWQLLTGHTSIYCLTVSQDNRNVQVLRYRCKSKCNGLVGLEQSAVLRNALISFGNILDAERGGTLIFHTTSLVPHTYSYADDWSGEKFSQENRVRWALGPRTYIDKLLDMYSCVNTIPGEINWICLITPRWLVRCIRLYWRRFQRNYDEKRARSWHLQSLSILHN